MKAYIKQQSFEELLTRKNISQDDFAKIIGVDRPYISMIKNPEKYQASPSPQLRQKMLDFFQCKFDDLFFIENARFNGHNDKECPDGQSNTDR